MQLYSAGDRLNEWAAALKHPPESASSESAETRQKPKEAERGENLLVALTSLSTCPDSRECLWFRTQVDVTRWILEWEEIFNR